MRETGHLATEMNTIVSVVNAGLSIFLFFFFFFFFLGVEEAIFSKKTATNRLPRLNGMMPLTIKVKLFL